MKVKDHILKLVSPELPREGRLDAVNRASRMAPADCVTALYVLSFDSDRGVAEAAARAFVSLPEEVLKEALQEGLAPEVVKMIERVHGNRTALRKAIDGFKAAGVGEPEARLLRTGTDAGEVAEESSAPLPSVLIEEKGRNDETNIYKLVQRMTVAEKIKLAFTGNKQARELLLKDKNKMIVSSVLKNPRITDEEVIKIANSREASQEILRQVASRKEWLKNYHVKLGLVRNPKTPLTIALKLLDHLYEKDLRTIAKSRNISSVLMNAALRKIDAKTRR